MTDKPIVSVIICTYNNADSLAITLQHLAAQELANRENVEIILVDNNSPDNTKEICLGFTQTSPIASSYIFENRQGLSHARNTGVAQARGDYILFTDDDADLPNNWINLYLNKITELKPDCLYSRISIHWEKDLPWWYVPEYAHCFAALDYGPNEISVTDNRLEFIGKNFLIKKSLIHEFGGFDPALGRNGTKLIGGEETLLYRNLVEAHKKIIYFPQAPVGHRLKDREYTYENIRKQIIDSAYTLHNLARARAKKKIFNRPLGAMANQSAALLRHSAMAVYCYLTRDKNYSYYHYLHILKSLTFIKIWTLAK